MRALAAASFSASRDVLVGAGGELLAQLAPLFAQLLQLRDGLCDLRFEGGKLGIHVRTLLEKRFQVNV